MKAESELKNWTPGNAPRLRSLKSGGVVLLTDNLAAREAASDAGVEVHGSIGVIALGYGCGVIDRDEAASRMRALQRERSLFVTEAVVERGIQMLDEQ
jgi:predicted nucleic acid-binding protein